MVAILEVMKKRCIVAILLCALTCIPAYAHSGKTDSRGGHTDHSTGEYHYHHGKPAHQHTNGVCPYDYKNAEKDNSTGGKTTGKTTSKTPSASAAVKAPTEKKEKSILQKALSFAGDIFMWLILILFGGILLLEVLFYVGWFAVWLFGIIRNLFKK